MFDDIRIYNKPPKTVEEHLSILENRGLIVEDSYIAKHFLEHIGYYRLSAYMKPLQENGNPDHKFLKDVHFRDIVYLYDFDRNLRLLTMDAMEKIEVSIKSTMNNHMCLANGITWYTAPDNFRNAKDHKSTIKSILEAIEFGVPSTLMKSLSIEHYYTKYDYPFYPPAWMVCETLSFGTASVLFSSLQKSSTNKISRTYGYHRKVIASWLHSLNYTRNLCAHHARLWNRTFTITPKKPDKQLIGEMEPNNKFYAQAVLIQALMRTIAPTSKWAVKLQSLIADYPDIDIEQMGFPKDWSDRAIWKPG